MSKFKVFTGYGGSHFVGEVGFGEIVAMISKEAHCSITSHARDQAAAAQLHKLGQHTQAEVIALHARGVPGYGPANPVTRTTHCRRNDGVAYPRRPAGYRLPIWARGIDCAVEGRGRFISRARTHGWIVTVTYPGSVGEAQHINFRKYPRGLAGLLRRLIFKPLKRGSKGPRVATMTARLAYLGDLPGVSPKRGTLGFGPKVEKGLKTFQRHWHLKADGVYGIHTEKQLLVAVARRKKERRAAKRAKR